uniref:Centromere protein S n=1 Tax=Pygocentrus nattereri TaxID=42514 RepID=A0AAR2KE81_PYGNA
MERENSNKKLLTSVSCHFQRLKAAIHYTVGRLCQQAAADHEREFSRQAIAALAEITFRQCDIFATDLEAFARHAKRQTVTADDVKLLARRSAALVRLFCESTPKRIDSSIAPIQESRVDSKNLDSIPHSDVRAHGFGYGFLLLLSVDSPYEQSMISQNEQR